MEIHWDGKTFKQATGKKEERFAVYAGPPPKLLGTPKIADGTGQTQYCSVMNLVDKWQLKASVVALVYDTTSANSGAYNGAAILIKKQIGRSLLECRHHIPELFIKELVELTLFFFGGHIKRGFRIRYASSDHHARWMSNAIYYTKIFLLPRTFELTDEEARKVERMAEYICLFYAKYFLQSAITSAAPANDLHFFYLMRKFKSIDLEVQRKSSSLLKDTLDTYLRS